MSRRSFARADNALALRREEMRLNGGFAIFAVRPSPKRDEWIAYERHPVPGGVAMAVLSRSSKAEALADAQAYLKKRGSCFRAESSVVGAKVTP